MLLMTIQDMLENERSALTRNIERLEHGIQRDTKAGLRINGQATILEMQMNHLCYIDHLLATAEDISAALDDCHLLLILAEDAHRKAAQHDLLDITRGHGEAWWNSLHDIEYYSDLIRRIQNWQTEQGR